MVEMEPLSSYYFEFPIFVFSLPVDENNGDG